MTFKPTVRSVKANRGLGWLGRLLLPGVFDGERSLRIEPLDGARSRFVQSERFSGFLAGLEGHAREDRSWLRADEHTAEGARRAGVAPSAVCSSARSQLRSSRACPEKPDEEAAEALRLDEAASRAVERLDPKAVLTVEDAGQEEAAEPAQLAIRLDGATVGLNVIAPYPAAATRTSSLAPSRSFAAQRLRLWPGWTDPSCARWWDDMR